MEKFIQNNSSNAKNISFPKFIIPILNQNLWLPCGEGVRCQRGGGGLNPEIITFVIL